MNPKQLEEYYPTEREELREVITHYVAMRRGRPGEQDRDYDRAHPGELFVVVDVIDHEIITLSRFGIRYATNSAVFNYSKKVV